jgi:hypothetical protein
MQLDIGISIKRYFPPSGTASFGRSQSEEPGTGTSPKITATTLSYWAIDFMKKYSTGTVVSE